MAGDKYILSSLNNSLKVMDLLNEKPKLGVAEISRELDIGKTSVFRILYTLEKNNYVNKDSNSKYQLAIKFANFGNRVVNRMDIVSIIKPYLKELTKKYNETTHMAVLSDDYNSIILHKETSNSTIQMASNIGVKLPAYNTATGKVLLADFSEDELNLFFEKVKLVEYTDSTITDKSDLLKSIKEIRKNGYAVDSEESEIGLICYAAPIKDINNNSIAAISLSGPAFRMKKNKKTLINAIVETANKISEKIGCKECFN